MSERHTVVCDVETTGLNVDIHTVVEVAWHDLATDETGSFVPIHDVRRALASADLVALKLNGYIDRIAMATQDTDYNELNRLHDALDGATLAGSNPRFDAAFLAKMFDAGGRLRCEPWHHRLWDLSSYAAGVLGLPELPGLSTVCDELGVKPGDHTAQADVQATVECFLALQDMVQLRHAGDDPAKGYWG